MKAARILIRSVVGLVLAASAIAAGDGPSGQEQPGVYETTGFPFSFYSQAYGVAGGYLYSVKGFPQKEAALLAAAMAGTEGSVRVSLAVKGMTLFGIERLFFEPGDVRRIAERRRRLGGRLSALGGSVLFVH